MKTYGALRCQNITLIEYVEETYEHFKHLKTFENLFNATRKTANAEAPVNIHNKTEVKTKAASYKVGLT